MLADQLLFQGRILGAEGDVFDIEVARKQLGKAYAMTEEIPVSSRALNMRRMILQHRVHMEVFYEQDCEIIEPLIEPLSDWTLDATPQATAEDREATVLIETYQKRCEG